MSKESKLDSEQQVPNSALENNKPEATLSSPDVQEIHSTCLNALAKDVATNIKELLLTIGTNGEIEVDEDTATNAGVLGEKVYIEAVKLGKSLSSAEITAFTTAIPGRKWSSEEEWRSQLESEISQALNDYCLSGACKNFIK